MKTASILFALAATTGAATASGKIALEKAPDEETCFNQFINDASRVPGAFNAGTIDLSNSGVKKASAVYAECMDRSQKQALTLVLR